MEDYVIVSIATFSCMALINCIFLAWVIVVKKPLTGYMNLFLVLLVLVLTLKVGNSIIFYLSDDISPFLYSLGVAGKFLLGPLLFFLVSSQGKDTFRWFHWLHFTPAIMILCLGWNLNIHQLMIFTHIGTIAVGIYAIFAWYAYVKRSSDSRQSKVLVEKPILIGTTIVWLTFLSQILYYNIINYVIGTSVSVMVLYWINYGLIVFSVKKGHLGKTKTVSPKKTKQIKALIEFSFEEEKIYRDPKLTLTKLADHIDQPVYVISLVINNSYNKTFPEFVNHYRVEALKKELTKFSTTSYTIEGMAYSVGFNTPSAFYAAFKKEIGVTPQQYIAQSLNKIENCN